MAQRPRRPPLFYLLVALAARASGVIDLDTASQPLGSEHWLCRQEMVEEAIDDALKYNWTGLGWSDEYVQTIASNLTGCRELMLDHMTDATRLTPFGLGLKSGCSATSNPLQLTALDWEGSAIEDDGLTAVAPGISACPSLSSLHLPRNSIGDAGARALAAALSDSSRSASGAVEPHASLKVLDLHANLISDFGVDGLANLLRLPAPPVQPTPLIELRLHDNRLGEGAFRVLADALRDNVLLETLMLSGNPLPNDAGVIALVDALHARKYGRDSKLKRLFLARTNLTDAAAAALKFMLERPNAPPIELIVLEGNPLLSAAAKASVEAAVEARRSQLPPDLQPQLNQYGVRATGAFYAASAQQE